MQKSREFSTKVKESEMGNRIPIEAIEQIFRCTTDCMLIYDAYILCIMLIYY